MTIWPPPPPKPKPDPLKAVGLDQPIDHRLPPDLDTQLEDLIIEVFRNEAEQDFLRRIDNAVRVEEERERSRRRKADK